MDQRSTARAASLRMQLDDAQAEAAALRGWIERHVPEAPILRVTDAGREILDRLSLAEDGCNMALLDGLLELRDALAEALSMAVVAEGTRQRFSALRSILNRWGDVHLRLIKR